MFLPTSFTLTVRRTTLGPDTDSRGNLVVHTADHAWPVYLVHAGAMRDHLGTNSSEPHRDDSTIAYTIGAPDSGLVPERLDQVLVDGRWLGVHGTVKNRNRGPFGFTPGVIVELQEVVG